MRLSVAVMAHRVREGMVDELVQRIDRPVEVVWSRSEVPPTGAKECSADRWDTGARAWLAHDPAADWHLVVQDDALVCQDLVAGLEKALDHVQHDCAVSLYAGRVRPFAPLITASLPAADEEPTSWLTMPDLNWGVAFAMPVATIADAIDFGSRKVRSVVNYDKAISRYWVSREAWTLYTWPSLVDHRDAESLTRHGEGRHAYRFHGEDSSALELDWAGATLAIQAGSGGGMRGDRMTFQHRISGRRVTVTAGRARRYSSSSAWAPVGRCGMCGRDG